MNITTHLRGQNTHRHVKPTFSSRLDKQEPVEHEAYRDGGVDSLNIAFFHQNLSENTDG